MKPINDYYFSDGDLIMKLRDDDIDDNDDDDDSHDDDDLRCGDDVTSTLR